MADTFGGRFQNAWNAFLGRDNYREKVRELGAVNSYRQDRQRRFFVADQSIVNTVYNQIAIDVASINIRHVRVDQNGRFLEEIQSGLNRCLSIEANIDQSSRAFIQDVVWKMFDNGHAVIVPVDTDIDPFTNNTFDIRTMRVGKPLEWMPRHIKVELYNDRTGKMEQLILPKESVAVVENPMYSVMNEPNSTLQRLIRKLALLDNSDESMNSGKLDLIIQLPYVIKSDARRKQAEDRRKDIEMQLSGSKYGIAYTDGTEKITQLNRSLENNLLGQVEYLTKQLYSQLGLSTTVFGGTASEQEMLNYYNRTVEPILNAITESIMRTFLTKTAMTQRQTIMYFRDPFKLVPVSNIAEIADKFTRNEILSSNEVRAIIGYRPVADAAADQLRNKNLNASETIPVQVTTPEGDIQNGV